MPKAKMVVVISAYNAEKTWRMPYVVDGGSSNAPIQVARELKLEVFPHNRNYPYDATCYREALRAGADIVVMVHLDYQYDPTLLPRIVEPIEEDGADGGLGSRLLVDCP